MPARFLSPLFFFFFCPFEKRRAVPRCPHTSTKSTPPRPGRSARALRAASAATDPISTARHVGSDPSAASHLNEGGKEKHKGRKNFGLKKKKGRKKERKKSAKRRERSNFLKTCPGKERAELRSCSKAQREWGSCAGSSIPSLFPPPPFFPPSLSLRLLSHSVRPSRPLLLAAPPPAFSHRCSGARR